MTFNISRRISFRWVPQEASEPTHTVVIGANGWFIDVRFNKPEHDTVQHAPQELSLHWAFAGRKEPGSTGPNSTRFIHLIDSLTQNPSKIVDEGVNSALPNGDTLETGSMINPSTGIDTPFEEVWSDEEVEGGILVSTPDYSQWRARAGRYEVAIGRNGSDFWAWLAIDGSVRWFSGAIQQSSIRLLGHSTDEWKQGATYDWDHTSWHVYAVCPSH